MQSLFKRLTVPLCVATVCLAAAPLHAQPLTVGSQAKRALERARDGVLQNAILASAAPSAQPAPRGHDSLLNGILIGAAVGALAGLIPDYYDDCEECHDSLYGSIAVGAGVGLLIDALKRPSPSKAPAPVAVSAGRKRFAVRFVKSF
jgi:predicted lipid-binding transport protein (Tim44 family)